MMISPRATMSSSSFLAFRGPAASPTHPSPPPSPRLHAPPPPLSASFSTSASACVAATPDHVSASFYDVLGLHAGASPREIKDAYRRLARAVHPDASGSAHPSADDFIRVNAAYTTLSDPEKRADYDRRLLAAGRHHPAPALGRSPSFPAYRRRTWETDQCW
ncbi:hypothetical protein GUJ93_ZPchr0006g40691 [Zizania palustris]|uniref:J domain-containing protein n=1 Tax=Zizania palustris TaxID=103762 RepID=A0A8J5SQZ2_ZIZPA|nr:hypothetical protein GUJ93_ZPchr0006g40691 [Zizania palustris]